MNNPAPFWETVALPDMTAAQWESLCDGCALCCLQKLEDEDNNEIYYTDVACQLLDISSDDTNCRCKHYRHRAAHVEHCMLLTPDNLGEAMRWLPDTCAYKRLAQQQPLPAWHPLLTGSRESVHKAGISARGRCVSELVVDERNLDEHVVYWVAGFGE
ncbi:MAG TPA: YcgN family cysteine cluster protein [Pseudomonadales bacterium]|nr:YcgN family cysteine cluster protein [Pseudomonadales bacterium]